MTKERLRIWGAPGTGKTTKLINIVEEEMSRGIHPEEIVFASFTRAAAHEARQRAINKFGGEIQDYPYFNTEHSICYRLLGLERTQVFNRKKLKEFGKVNRYEFSWSSTDDLRSRHQEAMLQTAGDYYEFFTQYMKDSMLPFDEAYLVFNRGNDVPVEFTRPGLLKYLERREEYKQENRLWDFPDMILGTIQRGFVPFGMRVLILDEMQDSSKLLWELAEFWSSKAERVYIAGDPLQTLYSWSGARPESFFEFEAEEEILKVSYRLTKQMKDFAKQIIMRTQYPFPNFESSGREEEILRTTFNHINWAEVGESFLLLRTRYLISQAVDYFIRAGIPFISERGPQSPLATDKGSAFHTLLKIRERREVFTKELVELTKFTKRPFLEYGAKASIKRLDERGYTRNQLKSIGFTGMFLERVLSDNFFDILSSGISDSDKAYLYKMFRLHGRGVFQKLPDLTITTIHGSKGREKPTVFVSPDMTMKVWNGYLKNKDPESLVYYVACTRAIDNLVLLAPQGSYSYPLPRV